MDTTNPGRHTAVSLTGNHEVGQPEWKIDNAHADAFLRALPEDGSGISHGIFLSKIRMSDLDYYNTKELLMNKKLISEEHQFYSPTRLCLTPEGKDFIASGGFEYEQKRKESSVKANRPGRAAIIISVIAIIVSIVVLVISIYGG